MKIHCLKTHDEYYAKVATGQKHCEIRLNDRKYKIGDVLMLCEFIPKAKLFTGKVIKATITDIVDNQKWLRKGYVAMSISLRAGAYSYFCPKLVEKQNQEVAKRLVK